MTARKMKIVVTLRLSVLIATGCTVCALLEAADAPARKPGLWQITTSAPNPRFPPVVERVCLDAATDALLYKVSAGVSQKMCSKADVHSSGGKVIVDSDCQLRGTQATTHSVTSFSSDTAYQTETTTHYVPAVAGKTDTSSSQTANWSGTCPTDMKPGDVVVQPSAMMPVPLKMNLNDMFKGIP